MYFLFVVAACRATTTPPRPAVDRPGVPRQDHQGTLVSHKESVAAAAAEVGIISAPVAFQLCCELNSANSISNPPAK